MNLNSWNNLIYKKDNRVIDTDSYVKIYVKGKKINLGDEQIMVSGLIDDITTSDEVNQYFYNSDQITESQINSDNILEIIY